MKCRVETPLKVDETTTLAPGRTLELGEDQALELIACGAVSRAQATPKATPTQASTPTPEPEPTPGQETEMEPAPASTPAPEAESEAAPAAAKGKKK